MIKNNKKKLIIASVITLLPMLFALLGRLLPEEIAVHFGIGGEADGFMNATLFFLILPPILLAIHWLCLLLSDRIEKKPYSNEKLMGLAIWVIPVLSILVCSTVLAGALGFTQRIHVILLLFLSAAFLFIGNYMPKATRSITMGIKVRWALANDENWQATHRFGGKVYVLLGAICLLGVFLPQGAFLYILFALILIGVVSPVLYSYLYYRKQLKEGSLTKESFEAGLSELVKNKKASAIVSACIGVVLVALLSVIMFTGSVKTELSESTLTVKASFWDDVTVRYEDITSVEYRESGVDGVRVAGFATPRLQLGSFRGDTLGSYTRYTYTGQKACIVLKVGSRTLVLGAETAEQTEEIYEDILAKISK